jgi:tRNA(fMet)-specific endonuclease VapC
MLILDTDHVSLLEWGSGAEAERLRARLEQSSSRIVATTIVSYEEQTRGWLAFAAKARTVTQQVHAYQRLKRHLDVYRGMNVLDFDELVATTYQKLRQSRIRIGTMDLRIAAIALAHNGTLLSRNAVDFNKVPGLQVEDWTR